MSKNIKVLEDVNEMATDTFEDFVNQTLKEEMNRIKYSGKCRSLKNGDFTKEEIKQLEAKYGKIKDKKETD